MDADLAFEPDLLVAALNAAAVEYVIVGGLAVGAHGVVRATRDVDIVPAPDQRNMDRLAECLQALGGEHPIEGPLTGASLGRPASFKVQTKHGEVQVLNRMEGTPSFVDLRCDQIRVEIAPDTVAPVCSLAHLRAMKRAADRPRDRVDLAELAELHGPS
ncbi:MAG: hypothetical protein ACRDSN_18165 [Pseudonocardiaceae bacterium]